MYWGQASLKLFLASLGVSEADSLHPPQKKIYYIHFDLNTDAFEKAGFRGIRCKVEMDFSSDGA